MVPMECNESPALRPRRRRLSYSPDFSEQTEDESIQNWVSNSDASTILYDKESPDMEEASTESPDMEVVDLTIDSEVDLTRDSEDEQSDYLA